MRKSFVKVAGYAMFVICLFMGCGLLFSSCEKDEEEIPAVSVTKTTVSANSIMLNVTYSGVSSPETAEFGVILKKYNALLNKTEAPTIDDFDQKVTAEQLDTEDQTFVIKVHHLYPVTMHSYIPYVKVGDDYFLGELAEFRTREEPVLKTGAIDLGLSVKWASCNVGAASLRDYGDYYAWGETTTQTYYIAGTSRWHNTPSSIIWNQGVIDGNNNLTADYDVATQTLGGSWRMPTITEVNELLDNCLCDWYNFDGRRGSLIMGPNGNYIFLPAGGFRINTTPPEYDSQGCYWIATAYLNWSYYLEINRAAVGSAESERKYGYLVRPVTE